MHWEYDGVVYATGVHAHTYGDYQVFIAGNSDIDNYYEMHGEFDLEKNIVFFKVPKSLVGNPKQGDVLTQTDAWAALRHRVAFLSLIFGDGELIKDWAGYGRDYVVQYDSVGAPFMHRIFGSTGIKPGYEINYNFQATDPEGEDVYFYVDWGDGSVEEWVGPYPSGEPILLGHTWTEQGSYTIRGKAKDVNGYESDWAEHEINVIKSRAYNGFFRVLLERYPLLSFIIKLLKF
jgi:hypothetical protein